MAEHNDLPYIVIERRSGAVLPFLWGALAGAAVALLWAPRAGRETQRELQEAADRVTAAVRGRIDDARDTVVETVDGVRQRVQDQVEAVREAVETRTEGVRNAVESGRRAAQEARDELEQRVADAKRSATAPGGRAGVGVPHVDAEIDIIVTEVVEERPTRTDLR